MHATKNRLAHGTVRSAAEFGDQDTVYPFARVSRGIDKAVWLIEAQAGGRRQ